MLLVAAANLSYHAFFYTPFVYDNSGKIVRWKLARKCNFEAKDKWYEHELESILENEDCKILWDFSIQTDHVIEARRPDFIVVDKKRRTCKIIDFALPGDSRIGEKKKKEDRKVSRSKRGVTEDLECESEDYTISYGLFRCYT